METIVKYVGGSLNGRQERCFFLEVPAKIEHVDELFQRVELYLREINGHYALESSRAANLCELVDEAFFIEQMPPETSEFVRFQSPSWLGFKNDPVQLMRTQAEGEYAVRRPDGTVKSVKKENWTGPAPRAFAPQEFVGCSFAGVGKWIRGQL